MKRREGILLLVAAVWTVGIARAQAESAREILDTAGVKGGLIVHVGCGDGKLTASLRAGDSYLVHGLDTDAEQVAKAREYIRSLGLYGEVSVRSFDGKRLPYIDNLVNLIVAEELGDVSVDEVMRVLAPRGVAIIGGKKTVKPWPKELDEWTHYLYDASGNAVSKDTRVAPPRHVQWIANPRWARSHEHTASVAAMVSGDCKIFYLHDEGISGVIVRDLPERWALYARDAFSGVLLWKKEFTDFGANVWDGVWHCREPMEIPRRLVFGGGKVFATLGFRKAAISAIEPGTGKTLGSFQAGKNNDELVWHDGVLLVRQRKALPDYPVKGGGSGAVVAKEGKDGRPNIPPASMGDETIVALDADTGRVLWRRAERRVVTMSLAALGERVCYHNFEQLVCLDLRNGRELWRADCPTWPDLTGVGGTLLMYGDDVVHSGSRGTQVFSLSSGKRLWQGSRLPRMSVRHPADLFAIDGRLWGGPTLANAGARPYASPPTTPSVAPLYSATSVEGFDLKTGKVTKELGIGKLLTPGHHTRCYRGKATSRFLIWPKRGMDFIDVAGGKDHERVDWTRGECGYGIMPSAGLVYVPPHPCLCYNGVLLDSFNALAPANETISPPRKPAAEDRLERGPAFGKVSPPSSAAKNGNDWPVLRRNAARSGRTQCNVSAELKRKWTVDIGGKLAQPVAANGMVFATAVNAHTIHALNATDGRPQWRYTADARIDSPPTIHNGLLLFGCTDGKVYCLRASDGELVWRFTAAPAEAHCVVRGQVESRWPVHGSVLVQAGAVYFCAGRSTFLDGGIHLYALDPSTGKVLHQTHLDGPWIEPKKDEETSGPYAMEGNKSDVLIGDGKHIFLNTYEFDNQLKRLPSEPFSENLVRSMHPHLMPRTGLLDDSLWDRGGWNYGHSWISRDYRFESGSYAGHLLCFDKTSVFALNAFPDKAKMSSAFRPATKGYLLSAFRYKPETKFAKTHPHNPRRKDVAVIPAKDILRWKRYIPVCARGMVAAGDKLFLAGTPDLLPKKDPYAALDGRLGASLLVVSAANGKTLSSRRLSSSPVFDGLIAADGNLFIATQAGGIECWRGN